MQFTATLHIVTGTLARAQVDILRDVSFCVEANTHVGILGEVMSMVLTVGQFRFLPKYVILGQVGSGKSTVFSLLLRFYDVTGGRILVRWR